MLADLSASAVSARLNDLRRLYKPMREHEARALLEPRPGGNRLSDVREVSRRLAELRALCELTRYLHRGRRLPLPGAPPRVDAEPR